MQEDAGVGRGCLVWVPGGDPRITRDHDLKLQCGINDWVIKAGILPAKVTNDSTIYLNRDCQRVMWIPFLRNQDGHTVKRQCLCAAATGYGRYRVLMEGLADDV